MLHRFRVAMVRASRELLSGEVEVDESMVGGVETGGKRGRGATKEIVAIAVEIKRPKGFGRIRMRHIRKILYFLCRISKENSINDVAKAKQDICSSNQRKEIQ